MPLAQHESPRSSWRWIRIVSLVIVGGIGICATVSAQPSVVGQWSPVYTWPYRPIHAQLLPTSKILFWDSYAYADRPQLCIPSNGSITPAAPAGFNIFCSGFALLPDGRMFMAGGHIANDVGLSYAATYDGVANSWSRLPNMNAGRWYPTVTTLANGDMLVVSGMVDTGIGMNLLPQVWQTAQRDVAGSHQRAAPAALLPLHVPGAERPGLQRGAGPDDALPGHLRKRRVDGGGRQHLRNTQLELGGDVRRRQGPDHGRNTGRRSTGPDPPWPPPIRRKRST